MKIFNIGSLNIDYVYSVDHFVKPGETIASSGMNIFPGGKGLNQSVALAVAGADVIHCGIIGNGGEILFSALKSAGISTEHIITLPQVTGHAIIQVDASGQNCIMLHSGTNYKFNRSYIEGFLKDAEENDIVLLQNEINSLDAIFEIAHRKKLQIAFNPSPYSDEILSLPLQYVNWWILNEIEGAEISGRTTPEDILAFLSGKYPQSSVILTLGKDGSVYRSGAETISQKIFPVKAVDTTAAGDTFTGYFLACISKGNSPGKALKTASAASAISVTRNGASSSVPTYEETLRFLKSF